MSLHGFCSDRKKRLVNALKNNQTTLVRCVRNAIGDIADQTVSICKPFDRGFNLVVAVGTLHENCRAFLKQTASEPVQSLFDAFHSAADHSGHGLLEARCNDFADYK